MALKKLSPEEYAKLSGFSVERIQEMIDSGDIRAIKSSKVGPQILVDVDENGVIGSPLRRRARFDAYQNVNKFIAGLGFIFATAACIIVNELWAWLTLAFVTCVNVYELLLGEYRKDKTN